MGLHAACTKHSCNLGRPSPKSCTLYSSAALEGYKRTDYDFLRSGFYTQHVTGSFQATIARFVHSQLSHCPSSSGILVGKRIKILQRRTKMSTLIATAVVSTALRVSGAANTRLGCNAEGFGMGRNFFSADLVKQSTFGSIYSPTTQNVSVDQVGWPTEDFAALLYSEPGGYIYPGADISGVYTVTAAGCASVASAYPGAVLLNSTCPPGGPLLAYVQVSDNATLVNGRFGLLFTQTVRAGGGSGLTNVSVLQPGFPVGTDPETFTPATINQFRRCSLIRFLGMTLVGHTEWDDHTPPSSADWSQRPRVGAPSYFLGGWGINGGGAPWETAAALSNAVGADMWVNVPSSSNETMRDDYLVQLVTLLDKVLAPGQRIFIEWGNECFFGNNQCYQVCDCYAVTSWHGAAPSPSNSFHSNPAGRCPDGQRHCAARG